MSAARAIEACAAHWLVRSEAPEWSIADQAALEAWLGESMAHKAAYWRLQHGWREADRIGSLGIDVDAPPLTISDRIARLGRPLALAASLVAAVGVGTLAWSPPRAPAVATMRFDTPVGGRRTIALADGSTIELNTATKVRARVTANARMVWLDSGEAYFQVAHKAGEPFVVHAGSRTVTVLGTKFSIRRDGDAVTVSVVEGRVRVDAKSPAQAGPSSIITAGDMAIGRGPSTLLAARSEERVERALAWRDGMLSFDRTRLDEAAAEFNRYNGTQVIITDPETAAIRIGGTFRAANVTAFVRLLHDAYGLRVTNGSDSVKISR